MTLETLLAREPVITLTKNRGRFRGQSCCDRRVALHRGRKHLSAHWRDGAWDPDVYDVMHSLLWIARDAHPPAGISCTEEPPHRYRAVRALRRAKQVNRHLRRFLGPEDYELFISANLSVGLELCGHDCGGDE